MAEATQPFEEEKEGLICKVISAPICGASPRLLQTGGALAQR